MGLDIYSFVEIKENGRWVRFKEPIFGYNSDRLEPFENRNRSVFNFLVELSKRHNGLELRGLPRDGYYNVSSHFPGRLTIKDFFSDLFNVSYLTLNELNSVDYTNLASLGFEDVGCLLSGGYFIDLGELNNLVTDDNNLRVVFGFQ